jgi:hypothetical protein
VRRVVLASLLILLAAPLRAEGPEVRVLVGGLVGLMTDADPELEPLARIDVQWSVYDGDRPVNAHVIADLTSLPGDAVNLADPASFRALEFGLGLSWTPFESIGAAFFAEGGFASRLPSHGNEPRDEAPKWASFGALFQTKTRAAWLGVGLGPDQRLDGKYVMAVQVGGGLDLLKAEDGRLEGTALSLMVSAVLGLEHSPSAPGRRDVVRAGVCVGWGK